MFIYICICVCLLLGIMAFSDEVIGLIETGEVLRLGAIDGVSFALVKEEREGLLSIISEYYGLYGKEKAVPYDEVYNFTLSPNGKAIAYEAIIDDNGYLMKNGQKMAQDNVCWIPTFSRDTIRCIDKLPLSLYTEKTMALTFKSTISLHTSYLKCYSLIKD